MEREKTRKIRKNYLGLSIVLIFSMFLAFFDNIEAKEEKQKVRVGCFLYDGYYEISELGTYRGYGVEYLEMISEYANFECEYIFGSWTECIEMLKNGEVDLLPMIPKEIMREDGFYFTENESSQTTLSILAKEDSDYLYEDFEKFDGMKVGVVGSRDGNDELKKYAKDNGFTVEIVAYDNIEDAQKDVDSRKIDAILTADIKNSEDYIIIANVGIRKYYMASNDEEIVKIADKAIEKLEMENIGFTESLYLKYFGHGKKYNPIFTEEEKAYIEKKEKLKIALYGDRNILSRESDGKFAGITYDLMELISKKTGIDFEYVVMPQGVQGADYFKEGKADIIAPVSGNKYVLISQDVEDISLNIMTDLVFVSKKDYQFERDSEITIVVNASFFGTEKFIKRDYPNAKIIKVKEQKECYKKVVEGEADVLLDNRFTSLYSLRSPYYSEMLGICEDYVEEENLYLVLSKESDGHLISIIQKAVNSISESDINSIIIQNTSEIRYEYSFAEFMFEFRFHIVTIAISISIVAYLVGLVVILRRREKNNREEMKQSEEKRKAEEKYRKELYYQAMYDSATGLLNRSGFCDKTEEMLVKNRDMKFVIIRGDVDKFKAYNDIMGTKKGDELIKYLANMWRHFFIGQLGTFGYLGSDDYICCLPCTVFDEATIMRTIEEWLLNYNSEYALSMSLGAYYVEDSDMDVNLMCDRAELALEQAKRSKKNKIVYYKEDMRKHIVQEQEIINYIPTALEEEQFEVYLQPQYDGITTKLSGAEALIRWNHPERGILSPIVFIPIMEENGLITQLDLYVVEQICKIIKNLDEEGSIDEKFSISVNLSRIDTINHTIIERIGEIVKRYGIEKNRIRVELTESAYVEEQKQITDFIYNLKGKGFAIEMDDFGSGYSSLNALKEIPIDTLKLDIKFICGEQTERSKIIVNAVIKMAKDLGIPVIAEGVETIEQVEYLQKAGCSYLQGYYFEKPMRVDDFVKLL